MRRALDTENSSQDRRLWQGALAEPGRNKGCFDRRRSRTRRAREVDRVEGSSTCARGACRALAAISYTVTPRVGALVWWGATCQSGGLTRLACPCASRNPLRLPRPCNLMCIHDDRRGVKRVLKIRRHEGGKEAVELELHVYRIHTPSPDTAPPATTSHNNHTTPKSDNNNNYKTTPPGPPICPPAPC